MTLVFLLLQEFCVQGIKKQGEGFQALTFFLTGNITRCIQESFLRELIRLRKFLAVQ